MKNLITSLIAVPFLLTGCNKDDENDLIQGNCDFINFKYYNGTEDYIGELSNTYILIGVDTTYSNSEIDNFISSVNHFDHSIDYTIHNIEDYKFKEIPLKFNSSKTCKAITQIISDLEENPIVAYAHFTMQTDHCENDLWEPIGNLCINSYGSQFYVKVFDENDLTDLNQMITATNTELVKQNEYMPKWFELRATKNSKGDALAMANFFYESELFDHSEPGSSKYPVK